MALLMSNKKKVLTPLIALGIAAAVGLAVACNTGSSSSNDGSPTGTTPPGDSVVGGASGTVPTPQPDSNIDTNPASASMVQPDPDFRERLKRARFSTRGWKTDFSLHTVPFSEIFSGGPPRDGIPPLDDPRFVTVEEAEQWLNSQEPVIFFEVNGDARAYPLRIMTWHEIANDLVGGVPIAVTFCPLCNSAIVFDRRLDGVVHDLAPRVICARAIW